VFVVSSSSASCSSPILNIQPSILQSFSSSSSYADHPGNGYRRSKNDDDAGSVEIGGGLRDNLQKREGPFFERHNKTNWASQAHGSTAWSHPAITPRPTFSMCTLAKPEALHSKEAYQSPHGKSLSHSQVYRRTTTTKIHQQYCTTHANPASIKYIKINQLLS
jgi:hypothetical protein